MNTLYAATGELLARHLDVSALFCVDGLRVLGVIGRIRHLACGCQRHLHLGHRVRRHRRGDLLRARPDDGPHPWFERGTAAVELVAGAIGQRLAFPVGIEFPVQLIERGSTGPVWTP